MTNFRSTLVTRIKHEARRLGFDHCRIVPVGEAPHADFFDAWIEAGRAGEMHYLERNRDKRRHPSQLLNTQYPITDSPSLIVLAVNYHQFDLPVHLLNDPSRGIIASYAWGDDYHEIIRPLLYQLDAFIRQQTGRSEPAKCLVDSGPVLERDWAMQAGIGFTGKNCCTIHPTDGSWLLLATMIVPERLEVDGGWHGCPLDAKGESYGKDLEVSTVAVLQGLPPKQNYGEWIADDLEAVHRHPSPKGTRATRHPVLTCGKCTRCLDACPTHAFVGPYHLDPQRCISYWTIETQSPIPRELRPHFGNRIFGCDICQEVCPWNKRLSERSPLLAALRSQEQRVAPPLLEGFAQETPYWREPTAFASRFRRSPIKRAKRQGMLRNVCVALGNWADPVAIPALQLALVDEQAVVRTHAVWALGQILHKHQHRAIRPLLENHRDQEIEDAVVEEINWVLA